MDREQLGRLVRATFAKWAEGRPDARPSWTVPWEEMPEHEREVDRLIGEAVSVAVTGADKCPECGKPLATNERATLEVATYKYGADAPSCWRISRGGSCSTPEDSRPGAAKGKMLKWLAAARRTAVLHQQLNQDSRSAAESILHYNEKIAEAVCGELPETGLEELITEVEKACRPLEEAVVDAARGVGTACCDEGRLARERCVHVRALIAAVDAHDAARSG